MSLTFRQIAHDIWYVENTTPRKTAYVGMIRKATDNTHTYIAEGRVLDIAYTLDGVKNLIETRYASDNSQAE